MDKVRVLVIATVELTYNGITSVIMNYYRNINRSKVQFDFVLGCGAQDWVIQEVTQSGGKIYNIPYRKKNTFKYVQELKKIIKENNYKIIHAHGNSGTLYIDMHIAKIAGASIRIAHSHNSTCNHKLIHSILKKPLNNNITHAFACSNLAGDWLYNKQYTVLNNGIEIDKFLFNTTIRNEYRKRLGIERKFVVGHIGHFSYQKNHEFLLDVFYEIHKIIPNSELILIGDGNLRESIEEKIKKLDLKEFIQILGKRNDVENIIQAMDVFVLPSRFEGLPVVLVETQASGLYCVASDAITKESNITRRVEYIDLKKGPKYWADRVIKYNFDYKRDDVLDLILNSKFNIKNETKKLEEFYLSQLTWD